MNYKTILSFAIGLLSLAVVSYLYTFYFLKITKLEEAPVISKVTQETNPEAEFFLKLVGKTSSDTILIYPLIFCSFFSKFKQSLIKQDYFDYMFRIESYRLYIILFNVVQHSLYK